MRGAWVCAAGGAAGLCGGIGGTTAGAAEEDVDAG